MKQVMFYIRISIILIISIIIIITIIFIIIITIIIVNIVVIIKPRGDGPLPAPIRHLIAILASAR